MPEDVRVLLERILKEGYSARLVAEWRSWRATRRGRPESGVLDENRGLDEESDVRVFKGQRVSVIRLDGKIYTSDDPNLGDEMRVLFDYIEEHGVTPALMETLRGRGKAVDLQPDPDSFEVRAQDMIDQARREAEDGDETRRKLAVVVAVVVFILIVRLANC